MTNIGRTLTVDVAIPAYNAAGKDFPLSPTGQDPKEPKEPRGEREGGEHTENPEAPEDDLLILGGAFALLPILFGRPPPKG